MATTLTSAEILQDVLDAFKVNVPALNRMGTDFRIGTLKLDKKYTAHIVGLPTVQNYVAGSGGYKNGAQSARGLMTDVDVTVNTHKHVPLKWEYINMIKDDKAAYEKAIRNAGYVLAKALIDSICAGFTVANFSQNSIFTAANSDVDMLIDIGGDMNIAGANNEGRVLLINTDVANTLSADSRITSREFVGAVQGGNSYRRWANTYGFADILEYPSLPSNSENMIGMAFESRAFALVAGAPDDHSELASQLGIPAVQNTEMVTDPETGLTMAAVSWQEQGTNDLYWSPTILWGLAFGKQGGSNGAITDYAGHRLMSASL